MTEYTLKTQFAVPTVTYQHTIVIPKSLRRPGMVGPSFYHSAPCTDVIQWLSVNAHDNYDIRYAFNQVMIYFKNESDMIMFKIFFSEYYHEPK